MKTNNNFTILVVDDEAFNIELVKIYLLEEGYKVLTALDAQGAIKAVKSHTVNLILLDINMPGKDGFEVCQMLTRRSADVFSSPAAKTHGTKALTVVTNAAVKVVESTKPPIR